MSQMDSHLHCDLMFSHLKLWIAITRHNFRIWHLKSIIALKWLTGYFCRNNMLVFVFEKSNYSNWLLFIWTVCFQTWLIRCSNEMKWNEWGFMQPLCTYRLNRARIETSWGWWDEWDTGHRKQNSNPGGVRPSSLLLGHGGSPQYWIFTSERGSNIFVSLKIECQSGVRTRDLRLSKQAAWIPVFLIFDMVVSN